MRALGMAGVAAWAVGVAGGAAWADAQEASVHIEALAGRVRTADPQADADAATATAGGVGLRFTVASHDAFAYELSATYLQAGTVRYPAVSLDGRAGDLLRRPRAARAAAGVTFRLGARYVPTLGLWLGGQRRFAAGGRLVDPDSGVGLADLGTAGATDLLAGARIGFDYRVDRHWIVGAAAGGAIAVATTGGSYAELTGLVHVGFYGYPRWF